MEPIPTGAQGAGEGIVVTEQTIRSVVPQANAEILDGFVEGLLDAMQRFDITTERRVEHFLAQCAHESSHFTDLTENLSYSAERMYEVWPTRFPSVSSAKPYARNPQALACKVYNGRMGNEPGTDDGWRFSGKGPLQATGRDMYATLERLTGIPLVDNPELAAEPRNGALIAGAIWHHKNCNALADRDDVRAVTKRINGGTIGLGDRIRLRKVFRHAVRASGLDPIWLKRGDTGPRVRHLQEELARHGFYAKPDSDFGKETEKQVMAFQAHNGIDADGLVGQETLRALEESTPPPAEPKGIVETTKRSKVGQALGTSAVGTAGAVASQAAKDDGTDAKAALEILKQAGEKAETAQNAVDPIVTLTGFIWDNLPIIIGLAVVGILAFAFLRNHVDIAIGKKKS